MITRDYKTLTKIVEMQSANDALYKADLVEMLKALDVSDIISVPIPEPFTMKEVHEVQDTLEKCRLLEQEYNQLLGIYDPHAFDRLKREISQHHTFLAQKMTKFGSGVKKMEFIIKKVMRARLIPSYMSNEKLTSRAQAEKTVESDPRYVAAYLRYLQFEEYSDMCKTMYYQITKTFDAIFQTVYVCKAEPKVQQSST